MEENRNPYLLNKALKNFLTASVLTMVVLQIATTTDSIIVSHLVNPQAMSAITLYMPVNLIINAIVTLLGSGAIIIATKAIGRRDSQAVTGILSTSLVTLLLAGVLMAVVGLTASDSIAHLLTPEEELFTPLRDYLRVMLLGGVVLTTSSFVNQCVDIDGHPIKVSKAAIVLCTANIVFDLLFVGLFGMGIEGSALATIMAFIVSIACLCRHLLGSTSGIVFRFSTASFAKYIGPNLKQGLPLLISNLVLTLLFYLMNNIVQERLGADGMFAMSVCMNIFMIGMMLANGFGNTLLALGGFLYGQRDYTGVRILVKRCLTAILLFTLAFTVMVEIFPSLVTVIFGANTPEMKTIANEALRIFIPCLAPFCLTIALSNLYQVLGRLVLSPILILLFPVALITLLKLFSASENDTLLWYAFPVSGVMVFIVALVISEVIRLKSTAQFAHLTLVPMSQTKHLYEVSLKNDTETFFGAIGNLKEILCSFGLNQDMVHKVKNGTEEMLLNTIQHSGIDGNGHYSDLRLILTDGTLTVSLKYEGCPFNPVTFNEEQRKAGLKIVFGTANEVDYKYMFGQNMMYLVYKE